MIAMNVFFAKSLMDVVIKLGVIILVDFALKNAVMMNSRQLQLHLVALSTGRS